MKRIIIYADGTWNTPGNMDNNSEAPTNVYQSFLKTKLGKCDDGTEQIVYYHEGVGTGNYLNRLIGGLIGKGIDDNIKDIYRFIVENYELGDEIFLFGFSRGAYTVRSVAGLIRNCGILFKHNHLKIDRAYFIYRSRDDKKHPNSTECKAFQENFSHPLKKTKIKFIGVWDTVGSLGIPIKLITLNKNKYRFHDVKLSHLIENAYHAVSIDEKRIFFKATLWEQQKGPEFEKQILEQCWFRGVHCDVGGGYSQGRLFLLPLSYLIKRAKALGLQTELAFDPKELEDAANDAANNSKVSFYKPFPDYYRIINKTKPKGGGLKYLIGNLVLKMLILKNDSFDRALETNEFIHQSVVDKYISTKDGLPLNLKISFDTMKLGRVIGY